MNTPDEREKMYIISRIIIHPTYLVILIETFTSFAEATKGMNYDERLELLKKEQYYDRSWDNWLQLIHSLESLGSDGEYDDRFVPKATIERVNEKIEQEWSEA